MANAQKPDFVFRRNGRVQLNRRGRQFSRLLAAEVCASAVVMLDTPCSEVVWRVLATHSIRQFPLHFPSRTPPCAITFQLESIVILQIVTYFLQEAHLTFGRTLFTLHVHIFEITVRIPMTFYVYGLFSKSCSKTSNFIFVPIDIIHNLHTFKAELHRYSAKTTQTNFTQQRKYSKKF